MFQERRQTQLFVGNIKAAGTGITLTAARTVAFLELPWTTGELSQAEDRCHRIGQKNAVNIYYILAGGTIEERIAALLDRKRQVVSAIIDGKEAEDTELLTALLRSYL
jgi:SNF2 family DNA or RNA helicase